MVGGLSLLIAFLPGSKARSISEFVGSGVPNRRRRRVVGRGGKRYGSRSRGMRGRTGAEAGFLQQQDSHQKCADPAVNAL